MSQAEPAVLLPGRVLVLAPHMDDELLGCGATLARLADRTRVHVAYVTDGAASPAPPAASGDRRCADLPVLRAAEAQQAMQVLGVPAANLHFLGLPDGGLSPLRSRLVWALRAVIEKVQPAHLLIPFRFDRHPDHLAINRAVRQLKRFAQLEAEVIEYFVYARTRLLWRGDLRAYLRPQRMVSVYAAEAAARKRQALECYQTQVTRYFPWQQRPILTRELLDRNCAAPEVFLRASLDDADGELFTAPLWLIRAAHALEPRLKRWKDRAAASLARPRARWGRSAA